MAYEVGVLCRTPATLSPNEAVVLLTDHLSPAPELYDWNEGESVASCNVRIVDSQVDFVLAVHRSTPTVFDLAHQAWKEGLAPAPEAYEMAVIFTLVDDAWEPVRQLLSMLVVDWNGLLFDEVSGFTARLD